MQWEGGSPLSERGTGCSTRHDRYQNGGSAECGGHMGAGSDGGVRLATLRLPCEVHHAILDLVREVLPELDVRDHLDHLLPVAELVVRDSSGEVDEAPPC